jgi:hypothetical protein
MWRSVLARWLSLTVWSVLALLLLPTRWSMPALWLLPTVWSLLDSCLRLLMLAMQLPPA